MPWKRFPYYWFCVGGIHWWPVNFLHKGASNVELWCFVVNLNKLWNKQLRWRMAAIWDAIKLIWRQCFRNNYCHITCWILNQTAEILQTAFSNAVPWKKFIIFWLIFHSILHSEVYLEIKQYYQGEIIFGCRIPALVLMMVWGRANGETLSEPIVTDKFTDADMRHSA